MCPSFRRTPSSRRACSTRPTRCPQRRSSTSRAPRRSSPRRASWPTRRTPRACGRAPDSPSRSASAPWSRSGPSASRSGRSCATAASTSPRFPGGYLREDPRPDLPPGVIGSLWRFGTPGTADIAATLMDMADKRIIAMRPTTIHHDGVLGIGARDESSFELGLNPELPEGTVEPDRPAPPRPPVHRDRGGRQGHARRDQVVREGPPQDLHRARAGVERRLRGRCDGARHVRDGQLVVADRDVRARGVRRGRRVLLGDVGRDGVAAACSRRHRLSPSP